MKISEIFLSVQGEGIDQGEPTIFIRTIGCNLRCKYCDTAYSFKGGEEMSIEEIYQKVKDFDYHNVCLTGGEPLLQKDIYVLIDLLLSKKYKVWVETNGSIPIELSKKENLFWVIDWKGPSSEMEDKMFRLNFTNVKGLREQDQIKFLVSSTKDYNFAKERIALLQNLRVKAKLLISPVFSTKNFTPELEPRAVVARVLKNKLPVRISIQIHKILWNKNKRGV